METVHVVMTWMLMGILKDIVHAGRVCRSSFEWIRDENDCSVFYRCSWGRPYRFDCPRGLVFSKKLKVCVRTKGQYDDCDMGDTSVSPITLVEQCRKGGLIPHPDECQLYYNCSYHDNTLPVELDKVIKECKYPQLFDRQLRMCRDFSLVDCDTRKVHKSGCQYRNNRCLGPHCIPCSQVYPSCEDFPDGANVFLSREWTPNYVICRSERTIMTKTCPRDDRFLVPQFFHPVERRCVNLYRIPTEHGGAMPSCENHFNGAFPIEGARPGTAYVCQGGQLQAIRYCPPGSRPEPDPRSCVFS